MVKCNICDKYYKRIDAVHLPSKHNITVDKYLELFPGSEVISKNTIEKYAAAQKIYASANPDKMKLRSKKGKQTITPEQQKKTLDECQYDLQIRNYHNDQTKNKIALDNGFKLVRIRQSESDKIMEIR